MNVLLIDMDGCCLDLALRAQAYGHDVRHFIGPDKYNGERVRIGDGLMHRVNQWQSSMRWADFIFVSDNAKYMVHLEAFRKQGFPIFGPNKETANWEMDREAGQKIFRSAGIDTIPSQSFKKYQEARDYVIKSGKRLVSKPNGDVCKALSYVSPKEHSTDAMLFMLDKWHKTGQLKDEFIMQEFVPGTEMAVGGYFGPNGFSQYYMENFEHKKLLNDDKGVNTGEMGTVLKYTKESELAEQVLLPLTGALHRAGHTGYIDVAVMIDKKGKPWPMEFTSRAGDPLNYIRLAVESSDPVSWMADLLDGRDTFQPSTDVSVGVVVTIPKFPYVDTTHPDHCGYPLYGITPENQKNIHYAQCMLIEAPVGGKGKVEECIGTAGNYVYIATGTDKKVSKAIAKAYKTVDEIIIPNSPGYRTDIGKRLEKEIPELQKLGFAKDWEY